MKKSDFYGGDISLLGFGLMRLPKTDPEKPDIDIDAASKMVDFAYSAGVTYFDTAWPYHQGHSEAFAGKALTRYPRESYKLASKLPTWLIKEEADVDKYFSQQLERCQTEYFDFYLIHALSDESWPTVAKCKIYEQLKQKKREGKIRHLGFSFHDTPELLREIADSHKWDFAQIQLNYLDWVLQDAKAQYEILNSRGIPVIVMEPVRGGALASPCPQANRIFKAANPDVSIASWAIRYAASLPGVLTVLSGMSNMEQVQDNVKTMQNFKPLDEGEREVIEQALAAYRKIGGIPCTACRYCMDCPAGVDIPRVFSVYNNYKATKQQGRLLGDYELMGEQKQADKCVKCNKCVSLCPQGIDIPAQMSRIKTNVKRVKNAVEKKKKAKAE